MAPNSITRITTALSLASLVSACTTLPSFSSPQYVDAFDGASVQENSTRYSQALECIQPILQNHPGGKKRFAVGRVNDFSGKEDLTNGKRITQGAGLMVISALSKAGVPVVERFDTSIADMELKYADNKLITDDPGGPVYRPIMSGSLPGSDFHILGGITEVNYNIRSGSLESSIRFIGAAARYFVMNVAVDLRVVNTKTMEVVNTQSLQKQIIGTELNGGYFRLFTDGLVDIAAAERTQEPIQKAVRMVIEQAVFNMMTEMNRLPAQECAKLPAGRPTSNGDFHKTTNAATKKSEVWQSDAPTATANPIILTPPPSANGKTQDANISIDPYTGEIVRGEAKQSTQQSLRTATESVPLKGLFGTNNSNSAQQDQPTSNTTREMQEKLLWGSRPQIR